MPFIFVLTACFFWAISFVASKIALESAPPLFIVSLRLLISALCFLVWYAIKGFKGFQLRGIGSSFSISRLFWLSMFGTTLHYGSQTMGLEFTSASNASLYAVTGPLTITLIATVWLKEVLTGKKLFGILTAMVGVLVVIGWDTISQFHVVHFLKGDGLVILSIFLWGLFTVMGKPLVRELGGMKLTAWVTLIGSMTMLPVVVMQFQQPGWRIDSLPMNFWLAVGFLGVTCSFLATLLYFKALEHLESQKVGVFLYTIPPMTYLFAGVFLNEKITLQLGLGSLLVLIGVFLTERAR